MSTNTSTNAITPTTEITDMEIIMHLFRLARSGDYNTRNQLRQAAFEDFPYITTERMNRCVDLLARKLA